ncbi:hypothetical protein [Roseateles asaccharophilus]|uniref:hypothetical protein n=1 Tax=Roseateles asaccharophilus TaxID=582607 RepID=UPI00384C518E
MSTLLREAVQAGVDSTASRVTFEVRQQVGTVRKTWLEAVFESAYERPARDEYERLTQQEPSSYFELVRVTAAEECLAHSNQAKP